ncbi:MAG: ATP-binding protein [Pirellulaceae bacterium]
MNRSVERIVSQAFMDSNVSVRDIDIRSYPEETIIVVRVDEAQMPEAIDVANRLDGVMQKEGVSGFVTVKKTESHDSAGSDRTRVKDLTDRRVAELVNLLTARSRTTELQPSLEYIPDAKNHIASVKSPRHHLVFGRRGSGKTALLAETKRLVEDEAAFSVWLNMQTYRHETGLRVFLIVAERICQLIQSHFRDSPRVPMVVTEATKVLADVQFFLAAENPPDPKVRRLIPTVQRMLRRFLDTTSSSVYIFLDDFHYLNKGDQPLLLDMVHGTVRDCNAWMKMAAIQHLAQWYEPGKQLGLQSGHDAASIALDITLQDPSSAKNFLEKVLATYAEHCGISSITDVFSKKGALDRLVLASGAVPRDYLTLCSSSIQEAQRRPAAKRVGVQDVNKAAGDAKQRKLEELEDDAAAVQGESQVAIQTLQQVRAFCVDNKNWALFRIDFREKESRMEEYGRLQILADLRFVHLIEPSLSDERRAGYRSEVYMLDLSQFAGQRLKRKLNVLDFVDGYFVLKIRTGDQQDRIGNTANRRLSLLRRAPLMDLDILSV